MNRIVSAADILAQAGQARGQGASQATVVEQSRAVAEVQSAFVMAQHRPRDRVRALNEALESCRTMEVAESAFFKFNRGNGTVSGESIHLARELARCWGNIFYTVSELDRDDERHRSEMVAYAIDLETNTQSRITFIVPHVRDTKSGAKTLTDMRDIYENNANMGARRLRECIFSVLPPYLVKAAAEQCRATLESGQDEKPLVERVAEAMEAFENIGVSKERIEAKLGPASGLTAVDVANLRISYQSIRRGEITAAEEFPRVEREDSAAAIRAERKAARKGVAGEEPENEPSETGAKAQAETPPEPKPDPADDSKPDHAQRLRDAIADAETLADLDEVQERFSELKPALKSDDITAIRGLLAQRRNDLA